MSVWLKNSVLVVILIASGILLAAPAPSAATEAVIRDKWVFFGDSITAMSMDPGAGSFSERVTAQRPDVQPIQVNAGVSGLTAAKGVKQLDRVLSRNRDATYVAISLGTNDSNGSATTCYADPNVFYNNYVTMVNKVLNAGKIPVVPTLPSAYEERCGWMIREQILRIYSAFPQVIQGPDLWWHFQVGPDGTRATRTEQQIQWFPDIHPSTSGISEYRQVWANEMVQRVYSTP